MSTHGEGGEGGGDGGQGDQQQGGPGGERVAKKNLTMGVVIYDIDVPIRCQSKNPNKVC
jgi:hypothetical protein